jgi:YfiH family protein
MTNLLVPAWPAPTNVRALQTLRTGGCSPAPWNSFNLGNHVGDSPALVAANRAMLRERLPAEPFWLQQVHGIAAVNADFEANLLEADAAIGRLPGRVCAVMTADCLPVLLCDRAGTVVAAAHAGWRGLAAGVLEATIKKMDVPASELLAWLGPAIGPKCFEVGDEVRATFVDKDPDPPHLPLLQNLPASGWPIFTPWPASVCKQRGSIQSAVVIFVPLPRLNAFSPIAVMV